MQKYSVSYDGEMCPIEEFPHPEQMEAYVKAEVAEALLESLQELITLYYTPEDDYISPYKEAWEKANAAIEKATS